MNIMRNIKLFRSTCSIKNKYFSSNVTPYTRPKSTTVSTYISSNTTTTTKVKYARTKLIFFRVVRLGRIVFISYSIYRIGYSQGFVDYAKNPEKMQNDLISGALKTDNASYIYNEFSPIYNRVNHIFTNIINSSRHHVRSRIDFIENRLEDIKKQIENDNNNVISSKKNNASSKKFVDLKTERDNLTDELKRLVEVNLQLNGDWRLVLSDSDSPNAFFNASIPRVIFVNFGLIDKLKTTDDEIALILGHEMSHMILAHSESKLQIQMAVHIFQLACYSLVDPVGYISSIIDLFIAEVVELLDKAYSRECECEADELGITLAARACYDTTKGANIFKKFDKVHQKKMSRTNWLSTHPGDVDRYETLLKLSKEHNWKNYSNCNYLKSSWTRLLGE